MSYRIEIYLPDRTHEVKLSYIPRVGDIIHLSCGMIVRVDRVDLYFRHDGEITKVVVS